MTVLQNQERQLTAGPEESAGERRVLTVLCYDIVASTALLESLDIEDYQDLMSTFQSSVREAIEANSGTLNVETGDGGMALFRSQMDEKDAASLAIDTGLEIVSVCRRVGRAKNRASLQVRIGIATSLFLVSPGERPGTAGQVSGVAFAMASRLQSLAAPDTVLVSHQTRQLVGRAFEFTSLGLHVVRGFSTAQQLWRAIRRRRSVDRFFAFGRRSGQLIGREKEMKIFSEIWSSVLAGYGQVLFIEGEGGIGKSRMVRELLSMTRTQRARLLLFQCQPGGARSALHPLASVLPKSDGDIDPSSAVRLFRENGFSHSESVETFCYLLGIGQTKSAPMDTDLAAIRERIARAVQRAVQQLCAEGPLVLVLEDLQWSDMTTRQLVMQSTAVVTNQPVLIVLTSRLPLAVNWSAVAPLRIVRLQALDDAETQRVVRSRLQEANLYVRKDILALISQISGGIPLFIEEICDWAAENAEQAIAKLSPDPGSPSGFERVVEARLATVGDAAVVARAASVVGARFGPRLISKLLPSMSEGEIETALDALGRSGFLTPMNFLDRDRFGFRHALIQETIYKGLLKSPRKEFHRRLFRAISQDPSIMPSMSTASLAEHAERAGLIEDAVHAYSKAGKENALRSAVVEAGQLLEHAIKLCNQISSLDRRDQLKLEAMKLLGPTLISSEGSNSPPARKLYDDGVELARRRPAAEQASLFPLYWGWWFTGTDVNGDRAHALMRDLGNVADPEVQLQARHCVWAIDFYLGKHDNCIACVEEALPLYGALKELPDPTLYGGHDAKVCGLAHRGLSLWFSGKAESAVRSVAEAKAWALERDHLGSIVHALTNTAMLLCYRRDFAGLRREIVEIRELTAKHQLPTLAATATILEGWCIGIDGRLEEGRDMIRSGLVRHSELQTPEDYPVYCCLLAEIMALSDNIDESLSLLNSAGETAATSGHSYWLCELHRRMARLFHRGGGSDARVAEELGKSLTLASTQKAVPILIAAYDDLVGSGLTSELVERFSADAAMARANIEPGLALFANPEKALSQRPGH